MHRYEGRRGIVQVETSHTPRIATKSAREATHQAAIRKEYALIQKLNDNNITFVPQICATTTSSFSYLRIPGEPFEQLFHTSDARTQHHLITELLEKAYQLDMLGVVHGELDKPTSNVLINIDALQAKKHCLFFIDFERGHRKDFSGKNLRHVMQRLQRQGYLTPAQCKQRGAHSAKQLYITLTNHMQTFVDKNNQFVVFLFCIGILVCLDLITKRIFYDLAVGASTRLLTPLLNTGIGWSIPLPRIYTILLASSITSIGIWRSWYKKQFPIRAICFIAGAWGNMYDRIVYAGVRDFIDVHRRPVFNFADILLTIACLLLLLAPNLSVGQIHRSGKK